MAAEAASPIVSSPSDRLKIFFHAFLFVFGFSLVFVIGWGGSVTALGQIFGTYKRVIAQMGGVIVIAFGLATLEVIRIP
jgi:cytochrome c-type biogenesis protein